MTKRDMTAQQTEMCTISQQFNVQQYSVPHTTYRLSKVSID